MGLEEIMQQICDTCHWPYVEPDEASLDDNHCRHCPIEENIRKAVQDAKGEVAKVVAECFAEALKGGSSA